MHAIAVAPDRAPEATPRHPERQRRAPMTAALALRTYAGRAARVALCAFLNAISPLASCNRARWFSSFLDQRMRMPRLRFSQE